jgi:pyruvate dehydrogenase E2 component (dihydrolipoamide acetyltransferase)
LLALRAKINSDPKLKAKVSVNDMVMLAVARTVAAVDGINCQWAGDRIKKFKYVDLSMAVALPSGLITPILPRACTLPLLTLSTLSKDLSTRARSSTLQPH